MGTSDMVRLDQLLVQRCLAESRARAQALILAGQVIVGEHRVDKPGTRVAADAEIRVKGPDHPYVSRGGVKLAGALDAFRIDVDGLVAMDVGASTGGFTDCLLQRGAARVHAFDVGRGQLHNKLLTDPRVIVHDRVNVRHLTPASVPESVDLAVLDLSFISLKLVLGPVAGQVRPGGQLLAMVKPQFEVGKGLVGKGGIVRDVAMRQAAVDDIAAFAESLGLEVQGRSESALPGADGNIEVFLWLRRGG